MYTRSMSVTEDVEAFDPADAGADGGGRALTLINARAVIEALFGVKTSFVRTPKYAITGDQKTATPDKARYRSRSGWLPYLEVAMGSWFLFIVLYCVDTFNFIAAALLTVFVAGYYWAAFSTLHQEYKDRLAWQRARKLEAESVR